MKYFCDMTERLEDEWRRRVHAIGRDVGSYVQCADELATLRASLAQQDEMTIATPPAVLARLIADWRKQARMLRNEIPNLRDGTDKRFAAACDADTAANELEVAISSLAQQGEAAPAVLARLDALERLDNLEQRLRNPFTLYKFSQTQGDLLRTWADELATLRASLAQQGEAAPEASGADENRRASPCG